MNICVQNWDVKIVIKCLTTILQPTLFTFLLLGLVESFRFWSNPFVYLRNMSESFHNSMLVEAMLIPYYGIHTRHKRGNGEETVNGNSDYVNRQSTSGDFMAEMPPVCGEHLPNI